MLRSVFSASLKKSRYNMKKANFFSYRDTPPPAETNQLPLLNVKCRVVESADIKYILSHSKPGALVILDIDDTIGRVSQTIGLDAWFRFRIQKYANEGHSDSEALANTIEIYNRAQLASRKMVDVDVNNPIAGLIQELKDNGVKVVALTARNRALTDKTLSLLSALGVYFSDDVLTHGCLLINNKQVEIKNGVIFANGNNKGTCLEHVLDKDHFVSEFSSYSHISFVDDSKSNCDAIASSLISLNVPDWSVWHYKYAEIHLAFKEEAQSRATVQEAHLLKHDVLLTDEEADNHSAQALFH